MQIICREDDSDVCMLELALSEEEQRVAARFPSGFLVRFRPSQPSFIPLEEWLNIVYLSSSTSDFIKSWSVRFVDVTSRRTRKYCEMLLKDAQIDEDIVHGLQGLSFANLDKPEQACAPDLPQKAGALKHRLEEDMQYQQPLQKMQAIEWTHFLSWNEGTRHQARPNEMREDLPQIEDEEDAAAFFMMYEWYDILDMLRVERLRRAIPTAYSPMWLFFQKIQMLMHYPSMEDLETVLDMDQELSQQMSEHLRGIFV